MTPASCVPLPPVAGLGTNATSNEAAGALGVPEEAARSVWLSAEMRNGIFS